MRTSFPRPALALLLLSALHLASPPASRADDEVLFWNAVAVRAMQTAVPAGPGGVPAAVPALPGPLQQRLLAHVHVAVFDAVNGITRKYEPVHVQERGPRGASRRVAAVYAAYTVLMGMFPAQAAALTADLETSLAAIRESPRRIARGREWGEYVGAALLARAASDGLNPPLPPYTGSLAAGKWRPTPRPNPAGGELAGLPGLTPTLATVRPFVVPSTSWFRPAGPPALASQEYADDVNEVKRLGAVTSADRTADQTESARFWGGAASSVWNRAAADGSRAKRLSLLENARLFALLNMSTADAAATCWDSKYYFEFWRPVHAIRLADTDGNPQTTPDLSWVPLLVTPPYPEYYSGHQSVNGAAATVLTRFFGKRRGFEAFSEGLPGVVRRWRNYAAAADEALEARIWSGIHFRFAMRDAREVSERIAKYVLDHAARPLDDGEDDDDDDDDDDDEEDDDRGR